MRVFLAIAVLAAAATATKFDVVKNRRGGFQVVSETDAPLRGFRNPLTVATGEYNRTRAHTGWDTLKIVTNGAHSDMDQAYAAGYFEGTQTAEDAYHHYSNNYPSGAGAPQYVVTFLLQHHSWVNQTVAAMTRNGTLTPYWTHVALMWQQWQGLFDGIDAAAAPGRNLTLGQLLVVTSMGDLFDLIPGLQQPHPPKAEAWRQMPKAEFMQWFAMNTHCSSLFKLTADMQDIYFGHVAWYNYNTMLRIFKHYTLNFQASGTTAKTISMSSYPGMLSSFDDFYVTDSGLGVIETSLGVLNETMYDGNIQMDYLLYWVRVMVSNRMAVSAPDWAAKVAYRNSGTYNNQWMILDMKLFTPGQPLLDNTMWVAEQMPGVVKSRDVTDYLRYGYYPSYNVPMDPELYVASGYAEAAEGKGHEMNSYQMCVRAQIFRRDQATVKDLETFKRVMQYNDFEQDPISQGNPIYAISARADLDPVRPQCFGGLDAKVSSYRMWKDGQLIDAFSGPTPQQPTFYFNGTAAQCGPHAGLPPMFRFGWTHNRP